MSCRMLIAMVEFVVLLFFGSLYFSMLTGGSVVRSDKHTQPSTIPQKPNDRTPVCIPQGLEVDHRQEEVENADSPRAEEEANVEPEEKVDNAVENPIDNIVASSEGPRFEETEIKLEEKQHEEQPHHEDSVQNEQDVSEEEAEETEIKKEKSSRKPRTPRKKQEVASPVIRRSTRAPKTPHRD